MGNEMKELLKRIGIFFGSMMLVFAFLFGGNLLVRNTWRQELSENIGTVFDAAFSGQWRIGEYVPLSTPMSVSSAVFRVYSGSSGESGGYAAVIRVTGVSGPVAAVYQVTGDGEVRYIGVAGVSDPLKHPRWFGLTDSVISVWGGRIGKLLEGAVL
ncbi:MAG: hypothetical protein LBR47_04095 [Spirochaetaceae bacterium]|jgi:hypothetical protein|nr:hypothetical protein [Spirochaetaceae bacterium]